MNIPSVYNANLFIFAFPCLRQWRLYTSMWNFTNIINWSFQSNSTKMYCEQYRTCDLMWQRNKNVSAGLISIFIQCRKWKKKTCNHDRDRKAKVGEISSLGPTIFYIFLSVSGSAFNFNEERRAAFVISYVLLEFTYLMMSHSWVS